MGEDIIRVLRVIEYEGPRSVVEETVGRSIHGEKRIPVKGEWASRPKGEMIIRAATVGVYPQILQKGGEEVEEKVELTVEQLKRQLDEQEERKVDPHYMPVD